MSWQMDHVEMTSNFSVSLDIWFSVIRAQSPVGVKQRKCHMTLACYMTSHEYHFY